MAIHLYLDEALTQQISEGDFSRPEAESYNGTDGDSKDRQLYVANEQTSLASAIDAVQMLTVWQINEQTGSRLPLIPILTVLGAMFIGFIELKSVYEKSEDKEKAKIADAAAALGSALKNRETQGIVAAVLEYMERAGRQSGSPRGPARSEQAPGPEFMPTPDIYDETEEQL